jgi:nicotinate phosphoribosyltransferase
MPTCAPAFFDYLAALDLSAVKIYSVNEGSVVFPRIPLVRVEGPLGVCQLLETVLLNLTNFACLMTTNASRFRLAAGADKKLMEFGLRRAQGPDGAMSASRYAYMGGFDGTSNVLAGKVFDIDVKGTHAHSFVCSFMGLDDLRTRMLDGVDIVSEIEKYRAEMGWGHTNQGELAAFISYAQAFPDGFLALVDTYDTLRSGVPNFLLVALALSKLGHAPLGVRLDSGDLAWLSRETRRLFREVSGAYGVRFESLQIFASNDINEAILLSLNDQGHEIDAFGIGTHLVTCQAQPALGMVYKLVEIDGRPRIKLSQEPTKVTIPGRKEAYRLIGGEGVPLVDLLLRVGEMKPCVGVKMLCRDPFNEKRRCYITPSKVLPMHALVFDGPAGGIVVPRPSLSELRLFVQAQIAMMRQDHLRLLNPTPYKVAVSAELYTFMHDLWQREDPIAELS